jgi:hypothetical protein
LSFIDVQARKLFHNYLETSYLDYEAEEAFLKVYDIQVNSRLDKIYYKLPRFQNKAGRVFTMAHLVLNKPDSKVVEYYESRKGKYTKKLNEDALNELLKPNEQVSEKPNLDKISQDVIKNKKKYIQEYKKRKFIDAGLIRNDFGLSVSESKLIKRNVEDKVL